MRTLRPILCSILLAICLPCAAENVMRFTLLKVMTDGVQTSSGDQSSIFVTINGNKCYDSDSQGFSNDTGVRTLMPNTEGYPTYSGGTYWGQGRYRFTGDYSRLNVLVGNKVYVYTRSAMAPGKSTYYGQRGSNGGNPSPTPPAPAPTPGPKPDRRDNAPLTAEKYQYHYDKFAEQAKEIYEAVTYKIRYEDGHTERRSDYSEGDSYYAYTGMLRTLRDCQREMRNLREEAARYGIRLTKSYYETVTVKR